ncbi:serine hydrolase [Gymnodinialimonas sp. 2305UL16-5]|uniref:serine hydrolase domain-containing protein n=1 Tax=Gymnodinialimonas mytili TaxID=3126503 RepID=UPI003097A933
MKPKPMPLTRHTFIAAAATSITPFLGPRLRAQEIDLETLGQSAAALDQLHSLIVMRDGTEVLAIAPRGPGLDRITNVKSVSKTLVALMAGVAIELGHLPGPDAPVLPLLGRAPTGDARDDLTVGNLLSMQAGLAPTSGPNYGAWVSSSNWVDYVLDTPDGRPGGQFIYSTGSWHVLGAILSRATGQDLHALARNWLAEPLGIDIPRWDQDPQGLYLGGNQMGLTPRGLARIGEMVRQGGAWNGNQVIPADWIATSWTPRTRSPWSGDRYGYGWFLTRVGGHGVAYGRGYGGQLLVVVPELGLTMAATSDPDRPARSRGYFGDLMAVVDTAARIAAGAS